MPQQTPPHARTSAHPTAVRGTGTTPKSTPKPTPKPTPGRRTADRRTAVLRSRLRKTRSLLPRASDYASAHRTWKGDVLAGITVGIVALPLALAFAVSSGMPPEAGLVTSVVAGFVAAVFGGSPVQVSGASGAMVVVLAPITAEHGVGAVPVVAVMAGTLVVCAGFLRLGRYVAFIPWPVIEGFTFGVAAVILLQQVPDALGVEETTRSNPALAAFESFSLVDVPEVAWALGAAGLVAAIMVLAPLLHPSLPGSIIGIVVVTVAAGVLGAPLVPIGDLPASLPAPSFPHVDLGTLGALLGPACAVATLASIESLLSARVASRLSDAAPYHGDRELVGQGLASVASGFFSGMPTTGAFARTAVNVRAGARSRISAIVHALVLLVIVYVCAPIVSHVPVAALAGVLLVTAVRMVSPSTVRAVFTASRGDAWVFVLTALVTISVDIVVAVLFGVLLAAILALRSLSRLSWTSRVPLPGEPVDGDERIALYRIDGVLFFGAGDRILGEIGRAGGISVVVVRLGDLGLLDSSGARVIAELVTSLEKQDITVLVEGIQVRHRQVAHCAGVIASLRHRKHVFTDLDAAIEHARDHVARERVAA